MIAIKSLDGPAQVIVPPVVLRTQVELHHLCLKLLETLLALASADQLAFVAFLFCRRTKKIERRGGGGGKKD